MLKFLRFNIGGFFGGYDEVRLWIYKYSAKYEILNVSFELEEEIRQALNDYAFCTTVAELKGTPSEIHDAIPPKMPETNKRLPVEKLDHLPAWAALDVNSWADEYFEPCCDGTQWELTYREDGKKMRRISGSNAYPPQWKQFIEWLDALIPEMNFLKYNGMDDIDEDESNNKRHDNPA